MRPLTYLACPYTHESKMVMAERFRIANMAAASLIRQGWNVFSPISHSVPIAEYIGNGNDSAFWVELDLALLYTCQSIHVLKLPGWTESKGVKREIDEAINIGLDVHFIEPAEV